MSSPSSWDDPIVAEVARDGLDFVDFGCSRGGTIRHVEAILPGTKGLGIDIDPEKVEQARASGHQAICFNINELPARKICRFVTMSHFLEHLHSLKDARAMISKALAISHEFVLIRQPWFDSDGYLLSQGLKFFWSHWHGHPNKMTTLDFYDILNDLRRSGKLSEYRIFGRKPIVSTSSSTIIPLAAPMDSHHYEQAVHGEKRTIDLPIPTFEEVVVLTQATSSRTDECQRLLSALGELEEIYSAAL